MLSGLSSRLQSLLLARYPRRRGDRDAFVFDNSKKENAEVAALRAKLQNMKVVARAKVTQDRVYSAAYHPEPTKDLIFFGGACARILEMGDNVGLRDTVVVKTSTVNSVYGMRVHQQRKWTKRTMLIRINGKRGSTGVCKCIGLPTPNRPSHASNSTL